MVELSQQIFNGLVIGSVYILMAGGLTIIFGVMNIVNFAHGEFYMLGAYLAYVLINVLNLNFFAGLLMASVLVGLIGIIVERILDHFGDRGETEYVYYTILATVGLSMIIANTVNVVAGPSQHQIISGIATDPIMVGPIIVTQFKILVIVMAFSISAIFGLFLKYSRYGKAMRATFENKEAAASVGIKVSTINMVTFAIGSFLVSIGGILVGSMFNIYPFMGITANLKAFAVVILGGLGSFGGAVLGGIMLGVIESITAGYLNVGYKDAVSFILIILVLMFKPSGLFNKISK
ncbi:MAG: branched-chain amino acid ABC transporter permease [Clostridia bacterium]